MYARAATGHDILSHRHDNLSQFAGHLPPAPLSGSQVQSGPTPNDDDRTSRVERGGWVRLRGLRPVGEDVVFLHDDRPPPPLHSHVISPTSLLGRLLIGSRVGETVVFDAAGGHVTLTIVDAGRAAPNDGVGRHGSGSSHPDM